MTDSHDAHAATKLWVPVSAMVAIISVVIVATYGLAVRDSDIKAIKDNLVLLQENQSSIKVIVADVAQSQQELQRLVDRLGYRVETLEDLVNGKDKTP